MCFKVALFCAFKIAYFALHLLIKNNTVKEVTPQMIKVDRIKFNNRGR
jgi:hypothetical protein